MGEHDTLKETMQSYYGFGGIDRGWLSNRLFMSCSIRGDGVIAFTFGWRGISLPGSNQRSLCQPPRTRDTRRWYGMSNCFAKARREPVTPLWVCLFRFLWAVFSMRCCSRRMSRSRRTIPNASNSDQPIDSRVEITPLDTPNSVDQASRDWVFPLAVIILRFTFVSFLMRGIWPVASSSFQPTLLRR